MVVAWYVMAFFGVVSRAPDLTNGATGARFTEAGESVAGDPPASDADQ